MPGHRVLKDSLRVDHNIVDPGNAGTIYADKDFGYVNLVSTAAETRTLADPVKAGLHLTLQMMTDGGDITITADSAIDQAGTTSLVFGDVQDMMEFVSVEDAAGAYRWMLIGPTPTGVIGLNATEIGYLDGATAGTVVASKAVVVDGSKDVSGIRNYTVDTGGTVDANGVADAFVLDADADTTISAPTDDQIDFEIGGADRMTASFAGEHAEFKLQSPTTFNPREMWEFFEDFNMKALDETNEQWILNAGSDDLAVDPAIVTAEEGTVFLDAGDGDGTFGVDGSQIVLAIPVQADSGGLVFEARVKIEDITGCSVNIGLTDTTLIEEPFSGATDTVTSVASNAVAFLFDDGNTTKEWFMCGVDGDTDATGVGATGTAPVDDTYQTLRCEIDADGEGAEFFINGTSVGSLTAAVCAASTDLYLTATICGDGANAAAVGLTVDYLYVAHTR